MLDKAPNGKISDLLHALDQALSAGDVERATGLFQADCYWRDLVTFTWNIKTMEGKDQVRDMLKARLGPTLPSNWKIADGEDASEADGTTESWIQFETAVARGFGHIRLKDGRIWTVLTTMSELKGYEEPLGFDRPMGAKHGVEPNRKTWKEERDAEQAELGISRQPYCVIVGGGQGGIALGARLRQLNVPTIIIEKNERPGDSWRKRYKSLCLHDPVWYDHLPYLPFPRNWPVFSPKDKIGDWLEMYSKVMELNYWGSTECKSASYDEASREWTVVVERDGKEIVLKPKQLVERLTEHSVVLGDGTELPADLVVYATGYGSMNGFAADLISKEIANKVGKVWGLGSNTTKDPGPWEGEQRNMWKPTQQEALWFHGGNLHQSRHYSQFLSLQLKARMEGIPTPVYGLSQVHHLS
jgi:putative flavoprotein involved in K+ transport